MSYKEYRLEMMSVSKLQPLSLLMWAGDTKCMLVLSNKGLTEFGEASVSTNTFSVPSLDGSTFKEIDKQQVPGIIGNKQTLLCM